MKRAEGGTITQDLAGLKTEEGSALDQARTWHMLFTFLCAVSSQLVPFHNVKTEGGTLTQDLEVLERED